MAISEIKEFLKIVPAVRNAPFKYLWSSYKTPKADVLYINFKKPSHATDSEITDDDIVVRYENGDVVGLTSCTPANAESKSEPRFIQAVRSCTRRRRRIKRRLRCRCKIAEKTASHQSR